MQERYGRFELMLQRQMVSVAAQMASISRHHEAAAYATGATSLTEWARRKRLKGPQSAYERRLQKTEGLLGRLRHRYGITS